MRRNAPVPRRVCYVHVGTHKAGSTAIQHFLLANAPALAARGVFVPVSGRLASTPEGCGHHGLAWDLLDCDLDNGPSGTLEALLSEIHAQPLPTVCLSSEELEHLHLRPNHLARLSAGLAGIGFQTKILFYLRPQADLLEALYAEVSRHAQVRDFWTCYRELLAHGAVDLWAANRFTALLDYERLIAPFASIVGAQNVIVRPYRRNRPPAAHIRDVLRVIAGSASRRWTELVMPSIGTNERQTFAAVLGAIAANRADPVRRSLGQAIAAAAACDGPFDPLRPHELAALTLRFGPSNVRLLLRRRVIVGVVSAGTLARALLANRRSRMHKRRRFTLLRLVFADGPSASHETYPVFESERSALRAAKS